MAAGLKPRVVAGTAGMLLVAALYLAHMLLVRQHGRGLALPWLLALLLPGALAAHLAWVRGDARSAEREGSLAGLLVAHFAAALQVAVLVLAVLATDWTLYSAQVGPEIASGVRAAAVPATIVAALVVVAITYAGCVLAGWLGALAYSAIRKLRR